MGNTINMLFGMSNPVSTVVLIYPMLLESGGYNKESKGRLTQARSEHFM